MVLKLGQHSGGAAMSNFINWFPGNLSKTDGAMGDSIQRSSWIGSQSTFRHRLRVSGQWHCL